MFLTTLLAVVLWVVGNRSIAALVALLVDIFKRFGLVKDGDAGKWAGALSLVGLVGFAAFFMLTPELSFELVDSRVTAVLQIAAVILAYVDQLGFAPKVHEVGAAAELPVLGYSTSGRK